MKIQDRLNGRTILIWGYGREGKSTENFIKTHCQVKSLEIFEGAEEDIDAEKYDYIIKSPGIAPKKPNPKYISQTKLFMEEFRDRVVGITGTKGKSTTSSLLYHVLRECYGGSSFLVGNIGFPCLDHYDDITEDTIVVYELSCHQLSDLEFSPHVAVFLNLYEDHLDRYITKENYFNAKKNITIHQNESDFLFYGNDVPPIDTPAQKHLIRFDEAMDLDMKLRGDHNRFNATFVYKIATEVFGLDNDKVKAAIESFEGLRHRLEFVGNIGGVDYFNDSISTIPQATIQAIGSIKNAHTILIGGMERDIDYTCLIDYIQAHQELTYIFMYKSGRRIFDSVGNLPCCFYEEDLEKAVELAKAMTPEGCACVLSPAAASYGYFKNFEERGDCYCALVRREAGNNMNASSEKSSTSLVFTGDIGFDRYMEGRWKDPGLLSEDLRNLLKSADHVITNVEGPIMEGSKNTENEGAKQLLHFMDPEVGDFLKGIGSDIWNICNNHIMDAGSEGIFSTLEEAKKHGVKTIGAGENIDAARVPVILPEAGGIGMFGVGYQRACRVAGEDKPGCFSWSDLDTIQRVINDIKSRCRWCIVVAHAGEEFTPLPSPYTRERYLKYLEMGADIVVAHHPHVPMNYETVGDKVIFYSLGNFIFDTDYQRSQFNTEKGLVVKLNFTESAFDFESYGIDIIRGDERIEIGDLPVIYQDVQEEEYKLLAPLSAKMLVAATKRQMTYLNPARFKDATEEEWAEHFAEPLRTGRVPGETLDFAIICPLAEREKEQDWKKSKHQDIVDYIQKQM